MVQYTYNQTDKRREELVNNEIMPYVEGTELEEQAEYRKELEEVRDDWWKLLRSGVYHDAIGKVVDIQTNGRTIAVNVLTEY